MGEIATLRIYRIDQCGYYERAVKRPAFCALGCALDDLAAWIKAQKHLGQTCPFQPKGEDDEPQRVFCVDVIQNESTGDYLFSLLNESFAPNVRAISMDITSPIGHPTVSTSAIPHNHVAGIPSYIWVLPDKGVLATIRLQYPAGKLHFEKYVKSYLRYFGKHVVSSTEGKLIKVSGYRLDEGSETRIDVNPRFTATLLPDQDQIDFLRKNRDRIRQVVNSEEISIVKQVDKKLARRLLELAGLREPTRLADAVPLKYAIRYIPSEAELEEMIASAADHDVGFILEGESKTYWLKKVQLRIRTELTLSPGNDGLFGTRALLREVEKQRSRVLRHIPRSETATVVSA